MIKALSKVDIKGAYLNMVKATYVKRTADVKQGRAGSWRPQIRNKTEMPTFTVSIQHGIEV